MLIDVSGQRQDVGTQSLRDIAGVVRCACGSVAEGGRRYTGRDVMRDLPTGPTTPDPVHFCPYGGGFDEEMPPNDDDYSGLFSLYPSPTN